MVRFSVPADTLQNEATPHLHHACFRIDLLSSRTQNKPFEYATL